MSDSRKDELCNTSFHMKAPTFGVTIAGYEELSKKRVHSVSVQRSTVGSNGRLKTDHMVWVGSPKFRSAAEASRFMQYVENEGDKALKDYTMGEIEIGWKSFRAKENAVEAHGAAQAVDVDADVGEIQSEEEDKEGEEDKSQGGEGDEPPAKKRRTEAVTTAPLAPVTPPDNARVG
jgi:hypothetical protein